VGGGEYDVAIVGSGPNGLTVAAYLARAGARLVLLERRFERGGRLATDDYSTPFQYNLALLELPLADELPPYRDLELHAQGVRFVRPEIPFAVVSAPGGEDFVVGRGGRGVGTEIEEMFADASATVAPLLYRPPAGEEGLRAGLADLSPRALAERAADPRAAIALRYACGLAGFLDGEAPLGLFGGFRVARLFSPAIVVGGSKNLANGIWRAAAGAGARGRLSSEVTGIGGSNGAFRIRTADARETSARAVVSTVDSRPPAPRAGPFTAHFGIKGDPPACAARGDDALIRIFGFGNADDVEHHFTTALRGELPEKVAGHLTAVSVHDPMQASPGPFGPLHTLRLQTHVPHDLPTPGWDRARTAHRARCWDALVASFPELAKATLLFQFCDTPLDIERRFGGAPDAPASTPGVYDASGFPHPGVPGSLAGGYNAAALVAEDLGLERWWRAPG
jgi:phytoene dehydrogenase-like protein